MTRDQWRIGVPGPSQSPSDWGIQPAASSEVCASGSNRSRSAGLTNHHGIRVDEKSRTVAFDM